MPKGNMSINISPEEIIGSEIMKSGEYRYARVGIKKGDDEYINISYEWKGDGKAIPEFVMGLLSFITSNKEELKEDVDQFSALLKRDGLNRK